MQDDGISVNFQAIKQSSALDEFCVAASELHKIKLDKLSQGERIAFFVNIYNTLLIHAYTEVGCFPTSRLDYDYICQFAKYSISGMMFSLNDILNGILRGNTHPSDQTVRYFSANDNRAHFAIRDPPPSILFLLANHLPKSPFVRNIDSSERLGVGLKLAAMAYIQEFVQIPPASSSPFPSSRRELLLPPLFSLPEFGETDQQLISDWILPYLDRSAISPKILSDLESQNVTVTFDQQEYSPFARPLISLNTGMLPPSMSSGSDLSSSSGSGSSLFSFFSSNNRRKSVNLSSSSSPSPSRTDSPSPPASPTLDPAPSPRDKRGNSFSIPTGKSPQYLRSLSQGFGLGKIVGEGEGEKGGVGLRVDEDRGSRRRREDERGSGRRRKGEWEEEMEIERRRRRSVEERGSGKRRSVEENGCEKRKSAEERGKRKSEEEGDSGKRKCGEESGKRKSEEGNGKENEEERGNEGEGKEKGQKGKEQQ
eukprot:CAMPEP_0201542266 /NCGR_PEP_ID=MMETSP0161_2-20130828/71940_1 /ASSEMBLY_ACC=CAM_ASM_000251 /TAXON_ID=180227 /ORGANISM="Neoparamoeba aestuarina, Strain SoJaBio B1-5/56/2" /LENGTH=480 /DNA_ID=CAMNT_0047949897 /DNA_START=796 /DNA_END=2238 /DNA_ORIENTATION=-